MSEIQGNLYAKNKNIVLIYSRFNETITKSLLEGARSCLLRSGLEDKNIDIVEVPGAFEIPLALKLSLKEKYDAAVCLACVIRGSTAHFDFVAGAISNGVQKVMQDSEKPVGFGVLTTDSIEQAMERAGTKLGNKGWEAAQTVIEMLSIKEQIRK